MEIEGVPVFVNAAMAGTPYSLSANQ